MNMKEIKKIEVGDIVKARIFGEIKEVIITSYPHKVIMHALVGTRFIFSITNKEHNIFGYVSHADIIEKIRSKPDNVYYGSELKQVA